MNLKVNPLKRRVGFHALQEETHYPYLFSLAMRTNPFDVNASVIVK